MNHLAALSLLGKLPYINSKKRKEVQKESEAKNGEFPIAGVSIQVSCDVDF